jgi:hypothetical protein
MITVMIWRWIKIFYFSWFSFYKFLSFKAFITLSPCKNVLTYDVCNKELVINYYCLNILYTVYLGDYWRRWFKQGKEQVTWNKSPKRHLTNKVCWSFTLCVYVHFWFVIYLYVYNFLVIIGMFVSFLDPYMYKAFIMQTYLIEFNVHSVSLLFLIFYLLFWFAISYIVLH